MWVQESKIYICMHDTVEIKTNDKSIILVVTSRIRRRLEGKRVEAEKERERHEKGELS